ncbi:unnamed protein product, partial [Rotaria sordida]
MKIDPATLDSVLSYLPQGSLSANQLTGYDPIKITDGLWRFSVSIRSATVYFDVSLLCSSATGEVAAQCHKMMAARA